MDFQKKLRTALAANRFEWRKHVLERLAALDTENNWAYIVTAYEPDLDHFEPDYKTRRKGKWKRPTRKADALCVVGGKCPEKRLGVRSLSTEVSRWSEKLALEYCEPNQAVVYVKVKG